MFAQLNSQSARYLTCLWTVFFVFGLSASGQETDKTLVAWASLDALDQRGGSILTLQNGATFDAIVYGERAPRKWMAGSEMFNRSIKPADDQPVETVLRGQWIQVAVVYKGNKVRVYRDSKLLSEHEADAIDLLADSTDIAIFGLRHLGAHDTAGMESQIEDARIYDRALSAEQLSKLMPDKEGDIAPVAWWDFEGEAPHDRMGRYQHHAFVGGASLKDGRLVLEKSSRLVATRTADHLKLAGRKDNPEAPLPPYRAETPAWPDHPPDNWVRYHLAHPGPGDAKPGDPNCIIQKDGTTHLHYIYRNVHGFSFAHLTSEDMVHWTWRPTVLAPPTTGHGMFSGTGFYTREGTPAIVYHGAGSDRNWIQFAKDEHLDVWSKPIAIEPTDASGKMPDFSHWDPDLWIMDGRYYALSGGKNPKLMRSDDLKSWTYLGDLLHEDYDAEKLGVPREEDISCANFFKMGDKWVLLCISHSLGCRYYVGDFVDEKFLPESHTMMSFGSNQFFAPESVLSEDGRRVMWAWIAYLPTNPTGVQSLPRELAMGDDGRLNIRPLKELESLRHQLVEREHLTIADGQSRDLKEVTGDGFELELSFARPLPKRLSVSMLGDSDGKDAVEIVAGENANTILFRGNKVPFELKPDEPLNLRIFVDKQIVELFINDRQAAMVFQSTLREEPRVKVSAQGGEASLTNLRTWQMKSIYRDPKADE